jgi:radical SAM protein with 4Fe4S-binding SPASM domain
LNVIPQNAGRVFDIVMEIVSKYGVPIRSLMIQRIIPSGSGCNKTNYLLDIESAGKLMEQIDRISNEIEIPILFEDPVPWCVVDPKYQKYLSRCEWGFTKGSIDPEGNLGRCAADDHYRLGSIWNGHIQDIWLNHPILKSFRSKRYLPEECHSCDWLDNCGGGCCLACGTSRPHAVDGLYVQSQTLDKKPDR